MVQVAFSNGVLLGVCVLWGRGVLIDTYVLGLLLPVGRGRSVLMGRGVRLGRGVLTDT